VLKRKRKKSDLAKAAGITGVWLSKVLSGHTPSWKTAKALALETESNPTRWADSDIAYMTRVVDRYLYGFEGDEDKKSHHANHPLEADHESYPHQQ